MSLTGINTSELTTGGALPPEAIEYSQAYIAGHASLRGFKLVDITTDCDTLFGAGALADQMKAAQLNSNNRFWAAVYLVSDADMTTALIGAHIEAVVEQYGDKVSTITIFHDADEAFANAVKAEYISQEANKRDFELCLQYRKAYMYDLSGVAATWATGDLTIPLPSDNKVAVSDEVLITRSETSDQIFGRFTVSARTDTSCTIPAGTAGITFEAGAYLKEHPDDYCMRANDEFDTFNCNAMSIVAPYTKDSHLGAYAGRLSKTRIFSSAGKVADGEMKGVDVDPDLSLSHYSLLDSGRFVFLKRFPERKEQVHVNDDNTMFPTGDSVDTMATRRVLNKAKRQLRHYGIDLVNDDRYKKDAAGASAAAKYASKGLQIMKNPGDERPSEIGNYKVVATWNDQKGIDLAYTIEDKFRIKTVSGTMSIVPASS